MGNQDCERKGIGDCKTVNIRHGHIEEERREAEVRLEIQLWEEMENQPMNQELTARAPTS